MKRLLILGASFFQIPVIKKAKEMGFYVAVADINEKSPGIEYADEYFKCSLVDRESVLQVAKEFKPDGITAGDSDVPVKAAAYVCTKLGLYGMSMETAERVTDKLQMIRCFRDKGVAHPEFQEIDLDSWDGEINIPFPLITKPIDKSASRGICLSRNMEELRRNVKISGSCSNKRVILAEEYMEGPEVSVEILVKDGIPQVLQVTDKLTSGTDGFVELGHAQPSGLPEKDVEAIKKVASSAAKALGLVNSAAHAEVKLTKDGPKMVEIGGRMGGGCITTYLLSLSAGCDLPATVIRGAVFNDWNLVKTGEKCRAAAIRFKTAHPGTISSISGMEEAAHAEGVERAELIAHAGDSFTGEKNNSARVALVIASGENAEVAAANCEKALSMIKVEYSEN